MELLTLRNLHRLQFSRNDLYLALLHNWDIDDTLLDQWGSLLALSMSWDLDCLLDNLRL